MCVGWGEWNSHRALELQEKIVAKKRNDRLFEDQLLLLEHEPVYTIGRTPDRSSLSAIGGLTVANQTRICRIHSFRSTAVGKRHTTARAN